ncbi:MAG: serpin family protein [Candidatus Bathyarchaeia archaeon]
MRNRYFWLFAISLILASGVSFLGVQQNEHLFSSVDNKDNEHDLVSINNFFAFDLYQSLQGTGENRIFSPFSVLLSLGMAYAGARGETEQQMANMLRFKMPQASLHAAVKEYLHELAARDKSEAELYIVNALWLQVGYTLLEDFLKTLAMDYGVEPRYLDFAHQSEPSRQEINKWISEKTRGKIENLIPPGGITSLTRFVLTNAAYLKAAWRFPFHEEDTYDGDFYLLNGQTVKVAMMCQLAPFKYSKLSEVQAILLPYEGKGLAMLVLLPKFEMFEQFEKKLDRQFFTEILKSLSLTMVHLEMPKFTFEWGTYSLVNPLRRMGMQDAFDPCLADFSGMNGVWCKSTPEKCLYIGDVLHKAFISVDEKGTEAAAATAIFILIGALGPEEEGIVVMKMNRPFIFAILDEQTGMILFLGRVLNPLT